MMPNRPQPAPAPRPATPIALGRDIDIDGHVRIDADVTLSGRINGSLRCKTCVIDRDGEMYGLLVADSVIVRGVAHADIYARRIELLAGSDVEGAAYHEHLQLDKAAYFEGKSRRYANPQSIAPAS